MSVKSSSVKSGNDRLGSIRKLLRENLIGLFSIQVAMFVKENDILCIYKFVTQIARHNAAVEVFTSGSRVVAVRTLVHSALDLGELAFQTESLQSQTVYDLIVALLYLFQFLSEILVLRGFGNHPVEKVGDLLVSAESLPGCRWNDIYSGRITHYDLTDFFKLFRIRQ